jgi:undecaprenyl-phosphate 4-deoxy-4-formamido-L-arabinose transferase
MWFAPPLTSAAHPVEKSPRIAVSSSSAPPDVSVVVPVYNSEGTLPELVDRIEAVLRPLARFEIVLVNDGSRDRSAAVIAELVASHATVVGIDLMRNYGQHNALLAGIRAARHDVVVTIDDDLQNPPEEMPKLLDALAGGYDVVYGTPLVGQHGLLRDLASQITKLTLQNAMGAETARKISAYRAFRRELRDAFATYQNPFVSIDVLLTWGTTRFAAIPVRHEPRHVGASNYTVGRLVIHALNMMTGFTTWPLQLASLIGFACTALGLVLLAWILGRYVIEGGSVPGFPFLASAIAIFSGAQLFALGIIGEYVARIHFRTMDRPAYTIRRTLAAPERS